MPVITMELSSEQLLEAAAQLSPAELEDFAAQVTALRAQRRAPSLPLAEADLLLKINEGLPPKVQQRYNRLIAKRRAETLTPDEYNELLILTKQSEQQN